MNKNRIEIRSFKWGDNKQNLFNQTLENSKLNYPILKSTKLLLLGDARPANQADKRKCFGDFRKSRIFD